MRIKRTTHFSIRTKLTIPYIILALLIAIVGGSIVTQVLVGSLEERFTNQMIESRKLASESMVREEDRMLGTLRLLSHTQGMADTILLVDKQKILDLIYPVTFNAGEDAVLVLDSHGKVLTTILKSAETEKYLFPQITDDLTRFPFVSKVMSQVVDPKGDKYSGLTIADWGNYFFVTGPVSNQDGKLTGIILIGISLKSLLDKIREESLSQVTIYDTDFNPINSTFAEFPSRPLLDTSIVLKNQDQQSVTRDVSFSNIAYAELLGAWEARDGEDMGVLGTALPKTFLVRTSNITKINITIVFVLAIIMAMLLGLFLSNLITRPLLQLERAASDVAKGNRDIRVSTKGGDEIADLAQSFNTMVSSLGQSEKDLISAYDKTIEGWSKALELRDEETQGHTQRVTELTLKLARIMGIDEEKIINIRRGALLHDIGKIGVPDGILLKPGPLNKKERKIIEKHPVFAREMLKKIEFLHTAMDIPSFHHERWDGKGYPTGLVGQEIPIAARIFAVIDVWDALTSDRPYRKAMTYEKAFALIENDSGTHFDPEVVTAFSKMIEKSLGEKKGRKTR
ncbi:MAG: HD domain-containing phosphohydrolase [Anaerolineales bacterium]|nr:HD domain-containing phosphohydrolase [Anaerolineales bacterium]